LFASSFPLAVLAAPPSSLLRAHALALSLGVPLVNDVFTSSLLLRLTPDRLELCKPGDPELPGALWVDFAGTSALRRLRHRGKELLVQAVKVRKTVQPLLIDTTAGLGRDGFLLAAAGFRVQMVECNPVVAALLEDGLERARRVAELAGIAERVHLVAGDALVYLPTLTDQPDVIYLDPMFPERTKSAKVKQDLRLLQLLDQKSTNPEQLLRLALTLRAKKVVVKRPLKGPHLLELPPSYMLKGKTIRFDVYVGEGKKGQNG
jgi:16S rRNA (guanine1516-N2)-methyltransferase